MPVTINGTTGITTPAENTAALTVGSITGILKATSGVVSQAVAGTDYLTSTSGGTITLATAQTASGTSIDFTSIPSWVKRITVQFQGVSTSSTSPPQIQIGSGSVTTSGYLGSNSVIAAAGVASTLFTSGFGIGVSTAQYAAVSTLHGNIVLTLVSGNSWSCFGGVSNSATIGATYLTSGSVTLSGALDRIRITTVNGTDTFDAGTINISYE